MKRRTFNIINVACWLYLAIGIPLVWPQLESKVAHMFLLGVFAWATLYVGTCLALTKMDKI